MTQADQAKVLFDNGFVDIVLPDGSVLSLKVDDGKPELWRYASVADHCDNMGDAELVHTYYAKEAL